MRERADPGGVSMNLFEDVYEACLAALIKIKVWKSLTIN